MTAMGRSTDLGGDVVAIVIADDNAIAASLLSFVEGSIGRLQQGDRLGSLLRCRHADANGQIQITAACLKTG